MKPVLVDIPLLGPLDSYSTFLLIGFLLMIYVGRRAEDRHGQNGDRIVDLGILMLICGVAGARILSVLADGKLQDFVNLCTDPTLVTATDALVTRCVNDAQCGYDYLCNLETNACYPPRDCFRAFKFWTGGLTYYGGFLLAAPVGLIYAHKKQLGVWRIADLTAPLIIWGLFFGRMGCFFNGCCYGQHTGSVFAMDFPSRASVHPTQLYEGLGSLAIAAFLYFVIRPRKRAHGQVWAAMLAMYGAMRFWLEFYRADDRGGLFGLSTSQFIGIPLVLGGIALFVYLNQKSAAPARSDDPEPSTS